MRQGRAAAASCARSLSAVPIAVSLAVTIAGCMPPMAAMQGASLVERGRVRVAPYYARVEERSGTRDDPAAHAWGALVGARVSEEVELQARYDYFLEEDGDTEYTYGLLSVGPKFAIVPERVALLTPAGLYVKNGGVPSWNAVRVLPSIVASHPVGRYIEPSVAGGLSIVPDDSDDHHAIANVSVAVSTPPRRFALIPGVTMAWNLGRGSGEPLVGVSVGLSFR